MAVVVENPSGNVYLGVSPDNPYKEIPSVEEGEQTERIAFGETVVLVPNRFVQDTLELEKHSYNVRVFSIFDFFLNTLNFIITGYLVSILFSLVSLIGYYGALTYNRPRLIGYILYQSFVSVSILSIIIISFAAGDFNEVTYILLPVLAILHAYICWYVLKFYRMLPNFGTTYTQVY